MALTDKLSAVGDAIRSKTGKTGKLSLSQMVTEILSIETCITEEETNVEYVKKEALRVANLVEQAPDGFRLGFITDLHYNTDNSIEHVGQALKALTRVCQIDCVAFGGDYMTNWTTQTKVDAIADINACKKAIGTLPTETIWMRGNHECNGYPNQRISADELKSLVNPNFYGYKDFTGKKVRVIYLNTSDNDNMGIKTPSASNASADLINAHNVGATQLQWLADTLASVPSDYNVVVLSHLPLYSTDWYNQHTYTDDAGNSYTCNVSNVATMLRAYINKTSVSITHEGQTISKSFASANVGKVCCVNGHTHAFLVNTDETINYISVGNACNNGEKASSDGVTYTKTTGTKNDTAFNIIDIDFSGGNAYCHCYGAGFERVVPLRYVKTTVDVDSVTIVPSSSELEVGGNVTLTANVLPSNATNKSVSWSCTPQSVATVSNGVVTAIGTGQATVTATSNNGKQATCTITVKASAPTNLLDTIGYKNATRLSTSSGGERSADNRVTTGYIPLIGGDVIRIKGMTYPSSSDGTVSICQYSSQAESGFTAATMLYTGIPYWNGLNMVYDGDMLTITVSSSQVVQYYIRMCGICADGANVVVTKNQPIS